MSQVYCIRRRKKGKHLSYEEREELESIVTKNRKLPVKEKLSQREIAQRMGVSAATISRELKKGQVILRDSEWKEIVSYSAIIGQEYYNEQSSAKGTKLKIGHNQKLVRKLENYILNMKYSPYATIEKLKGDPVYEETPISLRTLYNYIDNEYFLNLTKKTLPRKGKSSKRKYTRVRKRIRDVDAKRIDERPKLGNIRSEFGHWEMDCIESGRGKGRSCLLVLVERRSRKTLIFKLRSQSQAQVLKVINRLERKLGFKKFKEIFKSITVDNGSEFLGWRELEKSIISKTGKLRTQIYYCHPYHAWERGSNEQINGHIRRFIPKGSAISEYSIRMLSEIEKWLNSYPRKIFSGKSANEILKEGFAVAL